LELLQKHETSNCISSLSSKVGEIKIGCTYLLGYLFQMMGVYSTTKCGVGLLYFNNYIFGHQKYDQSTNFEIVSPL
jgi:hypothetical protein